VPDYALVNSWDHARQRLNLFEQYHDPLSRRRLEELGVQPGWQCLDVGAGTGSVSRWLCRKVGGAGHVVATDIDTRFLQEISEPNLQIYHHDIRTDAFQVGKFDLVCARWILHHLPHPERAVERMVTALRPGGWLLLEEVDFFPLGASASQPYVDFMRALTTTVVACSGGNCLWARSLPELLTKLGFAGIRAEADVAILRGGSPIAGFFQLTAAQMRERVIGSGALSAKLFDAGVDLLKDPDFWAFAGAAIGVWGKRPHRSELRHIAKSRGRTD
jgi:2-polyprenyl-3-methyl-5-hydroxy-6-metoxy-1,4-benzoquinol methylase